MRCSAWDRGAVGQIIRTALLPLWFWMLLFYLQLAIFFLERYLQRSAHPSQDTKDRLMKQMHPSPVWWNKLRLTHGTGALVTQRQIHHLKILPQTGWQPKNTASLDLLDQVAASSLHTVPEQLFPILILFGEGALWIWWVSELPEPWKFYWLLVSYEPLLPFRRECLTSEETITEYLERRWGV